MMTAFRDSLRRRETRAVGLGLLLLAAAASGAGCTSMRRESDLPWSTPQPWEGVVPLPGGFMEP